MEHENDILTVEKVDKTTDDNWTYVPKKQSSNQTIKQEYKEFSDFSFNYLMSLSLIFQLVINLSPR